MAVQLRTLYWGGAGLFASGCMAGYFLNRRRVSDMSLPSEEERIRACEHYLTRDSLTGHILEKILRLPTLRHNVVGRAQGDVLELAAGTGENFQYYNKNKVSHLVVTDISRSLLREAVKKKDQLNGIPTDFKVANAAKLDFPDASFDSVVQTSALCSFEKPEECLREARRVLRKDGRLLLIEHGLANSLLWNNYLNRTFVRHAHKYGCYHNRNILQLVEEAGFEILELKRTAYGTLYQIIAKKSSTKEGQEETPQILKAP